MDNGKREGRTMGGCNCPCGSIIFLCGVALIIHVSINCHFVVIVVHTPFSQSLSLSVLRGSLATVNTLTRGAAAPGRIVSRHDSTLKCQDEYQVFVHLPVLDD